LGRARVICLVPVDSFFFRGHQDFTAGETTSAGGIFPPRPGTVYGALRSAYIHDQASFNEFEHGSNQALKEWMGTPEQPGNFRLRGTLVRAGGKSYAPLPHDYQVVKGKALRLILRRDNPSYAWDGREYRLFSGTKEKSSSPEGYFVELAAWLQQMVNPESQLPAVSSREWLVQSEKTGIALSGVTRAAAEEMLYRLPFSYFKSSDVLGADYGFEAVVERGPVFKNNSMTRLGGRNRPARIVDEGKEVELFGEKDLEEVAKGIGETGVARLVFLTPAVLGESSRFYSRQAALFRIGNGLECKVLSVAAGRPVLIGGWDIVKGRPKRRYPAYPAGSVFYLEVERGKAADLVRWVADNNISDVLDYEGYGWAVVGPASLE